MNNLESRLNYKYNKYLYKYNNSAIGEKKNIYKFKIFLYKKLLIKNNFYHMNGGKKEINEIVLNNKIIMKLRKEKFDEKLLNKICNQFKIDMPDNTRKFDIYLKEFYNHDNKTFQLKLKSVKFTYFGKINANKKRGSLNIKFIDLLNKNIIYSTNLIIKNNKLATPLDIFHKIVKFELSTETKYDKQNPYIPELIPKSCEKIKYDLYPNNSFFSIDDIGYDIKQCKKIKEKKNFFDIYDIAENMQFVQSMGKNYEYEKKKNNDNNDKFCISYYILKNNKLLSGFHDYYTTYQPGDGSTTVYLDNNKNLIIDNSGDVGSIVVIKGIFDC